MAISWLTELSIVMDVSRGFEMEINALLTLNPTITHP